MIDLFYYSNFRKEMRCAKEHRNRMKKVTQGKLIFILFLSTCLHQNNRMLLKSTVFLIYMEVNKNKNKNKRCHFQKREDWRCSCGSRSRVDFRESHLHV